MSTVASSPRSRLAGDPAGREARIDLLAGAVPVLAIGALAGVAAGRDPTFALWALLVYAVAGATILRTRPERFPGRGMGGANRVTLARLVLSTPIAAFLLHPAPLGAGARWWIVGLGTAALILDGVDGWWARRTGTGTDFGARFDMETDAALLLVLSGLAWRSGAVGPWVWGIGALRYAFVAAGAAFPALRGELGPSLRRKVVCVIQGIALLVALGPIIPSRVAVPVVAVALASLCVSFVIDTVALLRAPSAQASDSSIAA
ncbi:MAG: CDP-alcohol phosphatidyltransferase family protein [Gemmatimonadetes bacterium]|nr:CDP-alcohol phosphatidyltransferase family protein [Gemmatimonadota bacterium]